MAVDVALKGLVRDELARASDIGEARSRTQLREACGIGSGDLEAILAELREEGVATEEAPDEYVLAREETPASPEVEAEAAAPEPEPSADERRRRRGGREADGSRVTAIGPEGRVEFGYANVTMPKGVLAVLDDEAVGKLVKAGVENAGDEGFVFEVTP